MCRIRRFILETNVPPTSAASEPDNSNESSTKWAEETNYTTVINDDTINIIQKENIDQTLLGEIKTKFVHYFDIHDYFFYIYMKTQN